MPSRINTIAVAEGDEHENTTTEGRLATKSFVADELQVGQVWDFWCPIVVNDNNSTDTLTIAVRFGTSSTVASNTACGSGAAVDSVDADFGLVWGRLEVQTTTRAVISGFLSAPDAANIEKACAFYTVLTIAPATSYRLDITADWSVAHADNEVAAAGFHCLLLT